MLRLLNAGARACARERAHERARARARALRAPLCVRQTQWLRVGSQAQSANDLQTLLAEYHDSSGGEEEAADDDGEQGGDEGMAALVAADGDPPMPDMMALGGTELECGPRLLVLCHSGNRLWSERVLECARSAP